MYFYVFCNKRKLCSDKALFSYRGGSRLIKQWVANEIICIAAVRRTSLSVLQFYCLREAHKQRQSWLGRMNKGKKKRKKEKKRKNSEINKKVVI